MKLPTSLRKHARGQPCQVRLPGCDGGGPTTVLAHYRLAGYCGTGMKPDDLAFGAWACASCHDQVDRRVMRSREPRDYQAHRLAHAEAVLRTIAAIRKEFSE
jgi:hypothetical protein